MKLGERRDNAYVLELRLLDSEVIFLTGDTVTDTEIYCYS